MDDTNRIFLGPTLHWLMKTIKNLKTKYGHLKCEYHSKVCVALMVSPQNAFLSISYVSEVVFSRLKQDSAGILSFC